VKDAFFNLWVAHIVVFTNVILMTFLKKCGNYTIAQVCQLVVVTAYLMSILLTIWTVKRIDKWWLYDAKQMTTKDVWLLTETIFFFSQVFAGMGFLFHIYFTKAKKFTMNAESLTEDKNPYNDKETEDMLRHFKLEYFLMTNALSFIITEFILLCDNLYGINCLGPITSTMFSVMVACMVPRILRYIYYSISLSKGNKWFEDNMKILNYFIGIVSYAVGIYCLISLMKIDPKAKTKPNLVIKVWMMLESASLFIEPTILIFLSFRKPVQVEGEPKIDTSTYGSVQGGKDVDKGLELNKEYAEEELTEFN
jgi:hypothetical protein